MSGPQPLDTPFARLRARLDAREEGVATSAGPAAEALSGFGRDLRRLMGPLARVPFPAWILFAFFLGIGFGTWFPALESLGGGFYRAIGYVARAAPVVIFFTLTPALVRMYGTASAGKFALYVVVAFVLTTTVGGLFALLLSLLFFPDMTFGFGAGGVMDQLRDVAATTVVLLYTSPLLRAIWGALFMSLVLYFGTGRNAAAPRGVLRRMLRTVMDIYVLVGVHGVAALGRVLKAVMPILLFLIGVALVTAIPTRIRTLTGGLDVPDPPWSPLTAYFVSVGALIAITLLWLALVSFALAAYTRFPLRRLITRYIAIVYPFAWATQSSAASIPVNITAARDGLGVRPEVRNFVLPIGATVNLDGTMMAAVVGTIVAAKMVGYQVSILDFLVAMIPLILITVGTPGVPGGLALIAGPVMAAVLPLPPGTEELFIAVFVVLLFGPNDMFRTAVNTLDNGFLALLLDKWWPERFDIGADVNPFLETGAASGPVDPGRGEPSAVVHAQAAPRRR